MRDRSRISALALFLAIVAAAPNAIAQDATETSLTLDAAIARAYENNRNVRIAEEAVLGAQARIEEARGVLLPSLTLTGAFTYNGKLPESVLDFGGFNPFAAMGAEGEDEDGSGDASGEDAPVVEDPAASDKPIEIEIGTKRDWRGIAQVQQPLFTWGKATNAYRAAWDSLEAARHGLDATRQDVALRVKEAFYGVLLAREVAGVASKALEQAERRTQTAQQRLTAGVATRLDLLQAQVALANARTQTLRAGNGRKLALEGLALAIGVETQELGEPEGILDWMPAGIEATGLVDEALMTRSSLRQLAAQRQVAQHMLKVARAANRPNLAATGTYSWNDTEKQDPSTTWSVGVGLSWPIFNGFANRARVRQALSGVNQASAGLEAMSDAVAFEVRRAVLAYEEASSVLQTQEETQRQAAEALRIANISFENGLITSVELADAELGKTQADMLLAQASYDALVARARLEHAVGAPIP